MHQVGHNQGRDHQYIEEYADNDEEAERKAGNRRRKGRNNRRDSADSRSYYTADENDAYGDDPYEDTDTFEGEEGEGDNSEYTGTDYDDEDEDETEQGDDEDQRGTPSRGKASPSVEKKKSWGIFTGRSRKLSEDDERYSVL